MILFRLQARNVALRVLVLSLRRPSDDILVAHGLPIRRRKLSAKHPVTAASATAPPTGSISAEHRAVANSIPAASTTNPSRTSSSSPSARTGKKSPIVSSLAAAHTLQERSPQETDHETLNQL